MQPFSGMMKKFDIVTFGLESTLSNLGLLKFVTHLAASWGARRRAQPSHWPRKAKISRPKATILTRLAD
jgi:hypothetical protein